MKLVEAMDDLLAGNFAYRTLLDGDEVWVRFESPPVDTFVLGIRPRGKAQINWGDDQLEREDFLSDSWKVVIINAGSYLKKAQEIGIGPSRGDQIKD